MDELETFLSAVETGSFRKAALKLNLTPPAVGARMQALENQIGLELFDRNGQGVLLTAAGNQFAGYARLLVSLWQECQQNLARGLTSESQLSIAANRPLALNLLPLVIKIFQEFQPNTRVMLSTGRNLDVIQQVMRGEADIALAKTPLPPHYLAEMRIGTDRVLLIVGPQHRWAQKGSVKLEELQYERILAWKSTFWILVQRMFEERQIPLRPFLYGDDLETLKAIVECSNAVTFAPEMAVMGEITKSRLVAVPLEDATFPTQSCYALYRKDRDRVPPVQSFLRAIYTATDSQASNSPSRISNPCSLARR